MNAGSPLEVFARLIKDRGVSHGAFRLWHVLRDYTNASSKCFPGQRRLAADIGCDIHSLSKGTAELVRAGWLLADTKPGVRCNYTVLDGQGKPLRKTTTPAVVENRNTYRGGNAQRGVVENHHELLWKPPTEVRSPMSKIRKPQSVPERIAARDQLKILRGRLEDLAADTSEQWQRDANPALVTEKQTLHAEITALENSLLL
jgi:hypothetical protein